MAAKGITLLVVLKRQNKFKVHIQHAGRVGGYPVAVLKRADTLRRTHYVVRLG